MCPTSRSGDGWSDTSWSDPSYAGSRPAEPGRRATTAPSKAAQRDRQPDRRRDETPRRDDARRGAPRRATPGYASGDGWGEPSYTRPEQTSPAVDDWSKAGPTSSRDQRATRAADRRAEQERLRTQRSVEKLTRRDEPDAPAAPKPYERGQHWWMAVLVLIGITALGAIIDTLGSISGQDGFNYGIVVASIVAILLVKRSEMFPIVVAPPIVYSVGALVQLYLKSSLSSDRKGVLNTVLDAVQNYLVYGFPALASATAAVLIIAGIRLIARK